MTEVETSRSTLFPPGILNRSQSSSSIPEGSAMGDYSFPAGQPKQEPTNTPPTIFRRQTYPPAPHDDGRDNNDNHPSPNRLAHLAQPTRPLSRIDQAYDAPRPAYYHHEAEPYGFPGSSGQPGAVDGARSASAANFEQLRHSIAAAQEEVSHEYSGLGRQVVMSGEGRAPGQADEYYEYHEPISPQGPYSHYAHHHPQSFSQPALPPQHLHPLQQQAPPTYIYGQPINRPPYSAPESYPQPGAESGWGEGYESHQQSPEEAPPTSVWRNPFNSGQTIPAHLLPPLPPLPSTQPPSGPLQAPRPGPYGHIYTPYPLGQGPVHGQVGGRDGWGPAPGLDGHYSNFGSHHPDESPYPHSGPGGINPVYVNPNAYSSRPSPYPLPQRYSATPVKPEPGIGPVRASTKKPAKPRSGSSGPPKPRQKSVIFHPSPQAMLAPEVRQMVAASALVPRDARANTPHIGTNAPALPDEETMKRMMTKRSRGRRPPAQAELIDHGTDEDPNLNPTAAQIAYCGVTKTGKPKKIFLCKVPECGKCFKRSEHLKRHVRSIHTNEKPFQCQWPGCARYFSRHDNLNQHLRMHRAPNQSDASFSAALEACFGAYHHANGFGGHDFGQSDYRSDDDDQVGSGQVSDGEGEPDY